MDMLKTGWNFFQNEVVGMAWLNRLIGNLINAWRYILLFDFFADG